ncbi:MAG: energy transducer TonB [Sphingobacteriales bacterium]|nr:energy transducer TonB [Sphingobacteriales bacterium]
MKFQFPAFLLLSCLFAINISAQSLSADSADKDEIRLFERVEVEAGYPGGTDAWRKFLTKTINASVPTDHKSPAGTFTVVIQFIVNKDGTLADFKALTSLGYGMETEVIRVLKLSGKWTPAVQNGRPVRAYRKQPVTFLVEEDGFEILTSEPYTLFTNRENAVRIKVHKVKPEDVQVTVSQGSITSLGEGNYIVKVSNPGRVVIRLYNRKKDTEIGAGSLLVTDRQ